MDLDEMKAGWNVLNERLAQNEILNKRVVKEMITARTKSAYETIYGFEIRNLCLILFMGLIMFPCIQHFSGHVKWITFVFTEIFVFLVTLFRAYVIYILSRFKLDSSPVDELERVFLRYKRLYWYDKKYGALLGLICLAIILVLQKSYTSLNAMMTTFVMLIIGGICAVIIMRRQEQKMKEVEKGMAELEEFENL